MLKKLGLGDLFLYVWGHKNRIPENQNRLGRPGKTKFSEFTPPFVVPFLQENDHAYEVKLFWQAT